MDRLRWQIWVLGKAARIQPGLRNEPGPNRNGSILDGVVDSMQAIPTNQHSQLYKATCRYPNNCQED